jgi:hypothetical protein
MLVGSGVADGDIYLVVLSIGSDVDITMLATRHDTVAAANGCCAASGSHLISLSVKSLSKTYRPPRY